MFYGLQGEPFSSFAIERLPQSISYANSKCRIGIGHKNVGQTNLFRRSVCEKCLVRLFTVFCLCDVRYSASANIPD